MPWHFRHKEITPEPRHSIASGCRIPVAIHRPTSDELLSCGCVLQKLWTTQAGPPCRKNFTATHCKPLGLHFRPATGISPHALTERAFVLRTLHRFDEAEPLFREAYEIHRRSVPVDHRAIGESATNLANVLITLDRTSEAEPIAHEAIAEHQLAVPQDDFALAFARLELGRDLLALGKFPEAEEQLLEANRMLRPPINSASVTLPCLACIRSGTKSSPERGMTPKRTNGPAS